MKVTTTNMKQLKHLMDASCLKSLDRFSSYNPSPLTLKELIQFGSSAKEKDSYLYLRQELPVRFANIIKEMDVLPEKFLQMPSVNILQEWYAQCFRDICSFEHRDPSSSTLKEFCQILKTAQSRNVNVVQTMAQGVLELQEGQEVDQNTEMAIQYFLDRFYMSRISIKMLLNQHSAIFGPDANRSSWWGFGRDPTRVGMIDLKCNVKSVIEEAYNQASDLCYNNYKMVPDVQIKVYNDSGDDQSVELAYPTSHLFHIIFELFKNSMRAVVETHKNSRHLPALHVRVAKGEHDVSIRVSDQGGGIPRHLTESLFTYLFSTAPRPSMTPAMAPLAGYGYGLPLSRQHARYFHGDLILYSYDGYGTDAVVYLKTLTQQAKELLPLFNKAITKQYKTSITESDWTDSENYFSPRELSGCQSSASVAAGKTAMSN